MTDEQFFEYCYDAIMLWETTQYTDNPGDLGGATKHGVTQRTLSAYRGKPVTKLDVRNLTETEARKIYWSMFWIPNGCHLLPRPLALLVFDGCVNQSATMIRRYCQKAIGGLKVDGVIGPQTALAAGKRNMKEVIIEFMSQRALRYASSKTFSLHGHGWFRRMFEMNRRAVELSTLTETLT